MPAAALNRAREVRDLRPTGRDTRQRRSPAQRQPQAMRSRMARSGPKTARSKRPEARSGLPRTAASRKRGVAPYERDGMRIPPPGAPPPLGSGRARSGKGYGRHTRRRFGEGGQGRGRRNPAQQRAAGTKKTTLFDIVKTGRRERRSGNATLERNRVGGNALGSRPRAPWARHRAGTHKAPDRLGRAVHRCAEGTAAKPGGVFPFPAAWTSLPALEQFATQARTPRPRREGAGRA